MRHVRFPARRLLLGAALLPAGCSSGGHVPPSPAAAAPTAAPAAVVAEVGGKPITLAEVDRRAAGGLQRLAQEEFEVRQQALEELVSERLLEAEAARRGVTPQALLDTEVTSKVQPPTPDQIRLVYEQSRDRIGDRSFAEVAPHIERSLGEQARAARVSEYHRQLRGATTVKVNLAPPRATVAPPAGAPALGPDSAPVTIVGFLDYQCPYCHRSQATVDRVVEQYKGKVRLVHQDFLLGRPRSLPAARAARCAGDQGKFWEYHRHLLNQPGDMSDNDLKARAAALALEAGRFASCLTSDRHDEAIQKAVADGHALGITGTPTFFVNGRRLVGARPIEDFQQLIDAELRAGG